MSELKFTELDFDGLYGHDTREYAARIANARLADMLKDAPTVYGWADDGEWHGKPDRGMPYVSDTHRADTPGGCGEP